RAAKSDGAHAGRKRSAAWRCLGAGRSRQTRRGVEDERPHGHGSVAHRRRRSMRRVFFALLFAVASQPALAQRDSIGRAGGALVVRTITLKHLSSLEAVKLLSPYSTTPGGGVYEVSPNVRAVTIRELPSVYNEMTNVLAKYDREAATVSLSFSLVRAD